MPRTIRCEFRFPDGDAATASIEVVSPQDFNPIRYDGSVERLPERRERASASGLPLWAANMAHDTGCSLKVDESGEFDAWAL